MESQQPLTVRTDFGAPLQWTGNGGDVIDQRAAMGSAEWWGLLADGELDSFGTTSRSGERVTHQNAMRVAAFWQGVTILSGDCAKLPCEIYKRTDDVNRELDRGHDAYRVLRLEANPRQTAYQFRRQMFANAAVWNNAYAWIVRDGRGVPVMLLPLLPDRTECLTLDDGRVVYRSEINGQLEYFDSYDIFHLKGISFDGKKGLDTVAFARDSIGKILAREGFASQFFKRGGRIGGVLQLPFSKDKRRLDKLESGFRRTYEQNGGAFMTVIMRENMRFDAAQASFKDTQMNETAQEDTRVVARLLNMPPHKLGDDTRTSRASLIEENQSYYDNSLSHWVIEFENEAWLKLFDLETRTTGSHFIEHTIGALLWANPKAVIESGAQGIAAGAITPNEVRRWMNLPPKDGGDYLLIPSGMVRADQLDEEPPEDDPADDDPVDDDPADDVDEDPPEDENDDLRTALGNMLEETTGRFVRRLAVHANKAAKNSDGLDQWLAAQLEADHLETGRDMFATIRTAQRAIGDDPEDHAAETIKRFRSRVANGLETGKAPALVITQTVEGMTAR